MNLIRESVSLHTVLGKLEFSHQELIANFIEECGRECYKSAHRIEPGSSIRFIKSNAIQLGHESMLEHLTVTAKITTNRGVTHQLVRHRLGAYSQESTRYCNYSADRFGNQLSFIIPVWIDDEVLNLLKRSFDDGFMKTSWDSLSNDEAGASEWYWSMVNCERRYLSALEAGWTPEQAREILPNSTATTIVATYNLRQWRHVLVQRMSKHCHPQMRSVAKMIYSEFLSCLPVFFEDLNLSC